MTLQSFAGDLYPILPAHRREIRGGFQSGREPWRLLSECHWHSNWYVMGYLVSEIGLKQLLIRYLFT